MGVTLVFLEFSETLIERKVDLGSHFFSLLYYFIIIFLLYLKRAFLAYKEISLFLCNDGKFLGWEDFFPRVNKEIHC